MCYAMPHFDGKWKFDNFIVWWQSNFDILRLWAVPKFESLLVWFLESFKVWQFDRLRVWKFHGLKLWKFHSFEVSHTHSLLGSSPARPTQPLPLSNTQRTTSDSDSDFRFGATSPGGLGFRFRFQVRGASPGSLVWLGLAFLNRSQKLKKLEPRS